MVATKAFNKEVGGKGKSRKSVSHPKYKMHKNSGLNHKRNLKKKMKSKEVDQKHPPNSEVKVKVKKCVRTVNSEVGVPKVCSSEGAAAVPRPISEIPLKKAKLSGITKSISASPTANLLPAAGSCSRKQRRKTNALKRRKKAKEQNYEVDDPEDVLRSSRFRFINEQLYTQTGQQSMSMFTGNPESFQAYHAGYRNQLAKWPVNPLDLVIANINRMPPSHVVVDLGCGDARLARAVRQRTVHSFDLVSVSPEVTACDMAHVPLPDATADVVVFCLALMGTNVSDFLLEANRLLRRNGQLRIAEVASRFESAEAFVEVMAAYGFGNVKTDTSHSYFYLFSMKKTADVPGKRSDLPELTLKPCLYKRR